VSTVSQRIASAWPFGLQYGVVDAELERDAVVQKEATGNDTTSNRCELRSPFPPCCDGEERDERQHDA
jgi:hypothetical protein